MVKKSYEGVLDEIDFGGIEVDINNCPMAMSPDHDISSWPPVFNHLSLDYDTTARTLWRRGAKWYREYIRILDDLIGFWVPAGESAATNTVRHRTKGFRRVFHFLLCRHFGVEVPVIDYRSDEAQLTRDTGGASLSSEDAKHFGDLMKAATRVDPQPDLYESAMWAIEKEALVSSMGWSSVTPGDVIGITAVGLLKRAVIDPTFVERLLKQIVAKPKGNEQGRKLVDDGAEVIEYAERLASKLRTS
jgi:hypothetical protein